jgi:hypothetical protein
MRKSEHRKNEKRFPVPRANHQRIVCAIALSSEGETGSREENASSKQFWQQQSAAPSQEPQK